LATATDRPWVSLPEEPPQGPPELPTLEVTPPTPQTVVLAVALAFEPGPTELAVARASAVSIESTAGLVPWRPFRLVLATASDDAPAP
jgi:hypothetical protein